VNGRKLRERLSKKVKEEFANVRKYLNELAEKKAQDIINEYDQII
jgi:hypothetical protein